MAESYQNINNWDYKTSGDIRKKKLRAGRSAGSPQYGYSLAQLACLCSESPNSFCLVLFEIIRHQKTFEKKKLGQRDQQEVLNMDIS
jgi:hypothetical protein